MPTSPERPVPVFPLPEVVLFPHARLPLRVFELRYRTLVRDALSGERMLAIATLEPGWQLDYHLSPAFHPLGCLARFEQVNWLPNDCYDLVVVGTERVRFGRVCREFPYRACEVEHLRATPLDEGDPLAEMERQALLAEAHRLLPLGDEAWVAPPVTSSEAGLEVVVNTIAHALRLDAPARLELLAMDSVLDRARRLHAHLQRLQGTRRSEPGESSGRN